MTFGKEKSFFSVSPKAHLTGDREVGIGDREAKNRGRKDEVKQRGDRRSGIDD